MKRGFVRSLIDSIGFGLSFQTEQGILFKAAMALDIVVTCIAFLTHPRPFPTTRPDARDFQHGRVPN